MYILIFLRFFVCGLHALRDAITELRYTPKAGANIELILSFTSLNLK
jgi:hypothetical protein